MFKKKRLRPIVILLSFLLIFSTVVSNAAIAAGKDEKTTTSQSKKDKVLKNAEQQNLLAEKTNSPLEKKTFSKENNKLAAKQHADTQNAKERKSKWEKSTTPTSDQSQKSKAEQSTATSTIKENQNTLKQAANREKEKYASNQIIVKYKTTASSKQVREKYSLTKKKTLNSIKAEVVKIPEGKNVENLVKELKKDPSVEFVQPNYKYYPASIPNDPYFNYLWGLNNTGIYGYEDVDIDYPEALDSFQTSSNPNTTTVAVIDTGIDINHPDLANNIWKNPNEIPNNNIDDDKNGYIDDINGWDFYHFDNTVFDVLDFDDHGTHVAGTLAAEINNGIGVSGVAPNVKIMPLKFLGPEGGLTSDAILAVEYATKMGVKISNNSWGGGEFDLALEDAIKSSNMLFVAAAGNEGANIDQAHVYPASFESPNVLSVSSINSFGELAYLSNYGANTVDLAAPGEEIYSTVPKRPELGAAAEIYNPIWNSKAIFNGFGYENIIGTDRQTAFDKAAQYLGATPNSRILLVQDDQSDTGKTNYLSVYTSLLANAGLPYDTWTVLTGEDGPNYTTLSSYDIVIWFSGVAYGGLYIPTLTTNDTNNLSYFLNTTGKSLLLSGQDILFNNESSYFVKYTLGLDVFAEGTAYETAKGVASTIYDGAEYNLDSVPYADYIAVNNAGLAKINLVYPGQSNYDNAYASYSGTSMAAPHVTGAAAMLLGANPSLDALHLKNTLKASGDSRANLGSFVSGGKTLNANLALTNDHEAYDDDIPGIALEDDEIKGTLDTNNDFDDVYKVHLDQGEILRLSLTGDANTDFDLYLYSPQATTVYDLEQIVQFSENTDTSTETIEFVANYSGDYYIDVYAYDGTGAYTLKTEIGNGPGNYEENSIGIIYDGNWVTKTGTSYSGNSVSQLNSTGGLEFDFIGSEFEWIGLKDNTQGVANIYIDGQFISSVSLYSKTLLTQQSIFKKTMDYGKHSVRIDWTGQRDPKSRVSGAINIDKLIVHAIAPKAPANVKTTYDSYSSTPVLYWDYSQSARFYKVYRKESGQTQYTFLGRAGYTYFYDKSAQVGKTYEYAVTAVGQENLESEKSTLTYIFDDRIPGILKTTSSIKGTVDNANDYMDVLAVNLQAGKTYNFSFNGPQGENFDYFIFEPNATDIYTDSSIRSLYDEISEEYTTLPINKSGTYYIVVYANTDSSGEYSININNKPTVNDDDIPLAVPLTTTAVNDYLDSLYDNDDVYSVQLNKGDIITLNLSSTATNGNDFDLYLYPPTATTVFPDTSNYVKEVASSNGLTSVEKITYTAAVTGKYYIDVYGSSKAGPYELKSDIQRITTKTIQENDPLVSYTGTWNTSTSSSHSGGTAKYNSTSGNSAQLTFNGTGIKILSFTAANRGYAYIYIDNKLIKTVNLYSSTTKYKVPIFEINNLTNGTHTIKIVNKGTKSASSTGIYITLDAFVITTYKRLIEENTSGITYSGTWSTSTNINHSGGTAKYNKTAGNYSQYTFSGTGVKVLSYKATNMGLMDIYIDGKLIKTVDLYSATTSYKVPIFEKNNLSVGTHTIKLVNKGQKSASSTGTYITLDALEITK